MAISTPEAVYFEIGFAGRECIWISPLFSLAVERHQFQRQRGKKFHGKESLWATKKQLKCPKTLVTRIVQSIWTLSTTFLCD